jgi:hypothetical protein
VSAGEWERGDRRVGAMRMNDRSWTDLSWWRWRRPTRAADAPELATRRPPAPDMAQMIYRAGACAVFALAVILPIAALMA